MQGILRFIERNIGSHSNIKYISSLPMARYFLNNRNTPSDVRQISALLSTSLNILGVQNAPMPKHIPQYTLDEKKLGEILVDKDKGNSEEPRIIHDVDCAAAILTLRVGTRYSSIADTKVVFATSSYHVVKNIQKWYKEEGESGVPPFVHIRALSNIAWLRKPTLSKDLKIHELVTLCQTVLQPSRKTWEKFIQHLSNLEKNKTLTSDEAVAIVVSGMTEDMLSEFDEDIDLSTLDEIVDRVLSTYQADSQKRIQDYKSESDYKIQLTETKSTEIINEALTRAEKAAKREARLQLIPNITK